MGQVRSVTVSAGQGAYTVQASGVLIGEDLVLSLWGGTRPHVGAIAVAVPRPSLADSERVSSTASVYTLVGHKDDAVAKRVAEKIAARLNRVVAVTAGMHVDGIDSEGIKEFLKNSDEVAERVLDTLRAQ